MTDPLDAQFDYKSKSIEEVIHDLTDKGFWQLANEVAKEGTRRDAANIIRKLCEEVTLARQAEQAAREKALEEAATLLEDGLQRSFGSPISVAVWKSITRDFSAAIRALKEKP